MLIQVERIGCPLQSTGGKKKRRLRSALFMRSTTRAIDVSRTQLFAAERVFDESLLV